MEHILYKDTLSVEKGLAVCKAFFFRLWPLIESRSVSQKSSQEAYEDTKIFCQSICQGKGSSAEWNEAIFRAIQISKENQREFKLTADDLFVCIIEFCQIYDKRYESNLHFLIQLLQSMKQSPNNYREEWHLLKKSISEIGSRNYVPFFDWDATFSEALELSVEQAFTVCIVFFINLWDLIEPELPPSDPSPYKEIYEIHELFCNTICSTAASGPYPEGHAEWNEAVFKIKKITKKNQKQLKLTINELFLCMIEFCKLYSKRYELNIIEFCQSKSYYGEYESNLHFLIQLLESMKQDPKNHLKENLLLKKTTAEVESGTLKIDLNWDVDFYEHGAKKW